MQSYEKPYIQIKKNNEEIKRSFLNLKQDVGDVYRKPKPTIRNFLQELSKQKNIFNEIISRYLKSSQSNIKIELEIGKASSFLESLGNDNRYFDISEEIWNYSKDLLKQISQRFWIKFRKEIPIPKIDFIEESIEIRWLKDKFKLILSITDYFNDIVIYVRTRNGQYLSEPVPRDEIFNWVLFWLNQF